MGEIKIPSGNELFWIGLVAFGVALVAIYLSNSNDTVKKLTNGGWF